MRRHCWSVFLLCLAVPLARADVKPHALITEGMVLQQGVKCPIWGTASKDEKITVQFVAADQGVEFQNQVNAQDGAWRVDLPILKAGGPYKLTIKGDNEITLKDVLVGEVWVASGQSNMQWSVNAGENPSQVKEGANHPKIRLFTVPNRVADEPQKGIDARWVVCSPMTVGNFSAVAYHFGVALHKSREVPIGLINSSWGGTICEAWAPKGHLAENEVVKHLWENYEKNFPIMKQDYPTLLEKHKTNLKVWEEAVKKAKEQGEKPPPMPRSPVNPVTNPNRPAVLYNGMIAPLLPYAIKGAIWYQGESNADRSFQYRTLFPLMIQSWRDAWKNPDMPFLFVQLAPFMAISKEPQESAWAELREAQLMTTKLKNAGMAVITDIGDPKDIHPKPKQPVGERLALAARALGYGEKITYSGPIFDSMKVEGNKAILTFKHVGKGLAAKGEGSGGKLEGFTIAGKDKKFFNAEARIDGDKIIVTCDKVEEPAAVRYGWANCPVVNLWNKDGLPASPFRTDTWPGVTDKAK